MKTKYFAFAVLATMLASCSNEEGIITQVDNLKDTPITVNALVGELTTRAGYDAENLPEQFYLEIDNPDNDKYDYSALMKYENNAWVAYDATTPENKITLLWQNSTTNVEVTAATYSLDTEQTALTVETDQSTADNIKASDHLYYNASVAPSADGISVAFNHVMSKVLLTITLGTEFDYEDNPIKELTIDGITPLAISYSNPAAQYEVILVPETKEAETFTVQFKVDGRAFKWTSADAVTLQSGYQYTLNLTAGKDLVSPTSFSATAWNTGEDESNNLEGETE